MRGVVAEYLVAQALGVAGGVREEWAPYDVDAPGGIRVEVKSAAYIQSWNQRAAFADHVPDTEKSCVEQTLTGKKRAIRIEEAIMDLYGLVYACVEYHKSRDAQQQ